MPSIKYDKNKILAYHYENPALTIDEVANYFGCSKSTIYRATGKGSFINRRNKPSKFSSYKIALYRLKNPNASVKDVARHFGCSPITVSKLAPKKSLLSIDSSDKSPDSAQEFYKKYRLEHPDLSIQEVATRLGVSYNTVARFAPDKFFMDNNKRAEIINDFSANPFIHIDKIAKKYSIDPHTVYYYICFAELKKSKTLRNLINYIKSNTSLTPEEIATAMGYSLDAKITIKDK